MTARLPTFFEHIPSRAATWRLRTRTLQFGAVPMVMGIVNVTPDSFSDGGRFFGREAAVEQAMRLVADGADLLDIGGESTRPYSTPVSEKEELERILPVVEQVCRLTSVPVSIDTTKVVVARAALAAGAEIINDITGLADPAMVALARTTDAGVCAMHMQGTPQTMQDSPRYEDVVADVGAYLGRRRDELVSAGLERARIALDPGVGFGKTHQHNLTLLAACHTYHRLGQPLLVGHSRKGFIAKLLQNKELDRTPGTIGVSCSLARQQVQVIRVHDVGPVRQALLLFAASGGIDGRALELP